MITEDNLDISIHFREGPLGPDRVGLSATLHLACGFYVAPGDTFEDLRERAKEAILHKLYGDIKDRLDAARIVAICSAGPDARYNDMNQAFDAVFNPEEKK